MPTPSAVSSVTRTAARPKTVPAGDKKSPPHPFRAPAPFVGTDARRYPYWVHPADGLSAPEDPMIGRVLAGKYLIHRCVGEGGAGCVYEAKHTGLDRRIAIKTLHPHFQQDPEIAKRFRREAQATSRIQHPNCVQVFDFGQEPDGTLYIAMEFLRGESLRQRLNQRGCLTPLVACRILQQVLSLLQTTHQLDLVHRDIKPENILILGTANGRDFVKVCDFGISRTINSKQTRLTRTGSVIGTPTYMAPEQVADEAVDARADLYACGVLLFEMIAGQPPFDAENIGHIFAKVLTEEPPRLNSMLVEPIPELDALIHRALQKNPADRFPNAYQMLAAVSRFIQEPAPSLEDSIPGVFNDTGPATDPGFAPTLLRPDTKKPNPEGTAPPDAITLSRPLVSIPNLNVPLHRRASFWVGTAAMLAGAIGGGAYFSRPKLDVEQLERWSRGRAYGALETYAVENFPLFRRNIRAMALLEQAFEQRRDIEALTRLCGEPFRSDYLLTPGRWRGEVDDKNSGRTHHFNLQITDSLDHSLTGSIEWPDFGVQRSLVGFWFGNHILFYDNDFLRADQEHFQRLFTGAEKSVALLGPTGKISGIGGIDRNPFRAHPIGATPP